MTLTEARENIGRKVVYTAPHGAKEDGIITTVGFTYVFVRYGNNQHGSATDPKRLALL